MMLVCRWPGCFRRLPIGAHKNKSTYCTEHQLLANLTREPKKKAKIRRNRNEAARLQQRLSEVETAAAFLIKQNMDGMVAYNAELIALKARVVAVLDNSDFVSNDLEIQELKDYCKSVPAR
jgi:hypothetical protein